MTEFNAWDWYWIAWLLLGFGIPEAYALYRAVKYNEEGCTLSENIRQWFSTDVKGWKDKTASGKLRRLFFILGLTWVTLHWIVPGIF